MPETTRDDVFKDVYVELGRNFRHFLMWRRLLFAGYFAVLAGVGAAFNSVTSSSPQLSPWLPGVAVVLTTVFWLLDVRNRNLIRIASDAGAHLENDLGLGETGYYSLYKRRHEERKPKSDKYVLTHSWILGVFYLLAIVAFGILLVGLIFR